MPGLGLPRRGTKVDVDVKKSIDDVRATVAPNHWRCSACPSECAMKTETFRSCPEPREHYLTVSAYGTITGTARRSKKDWRTDL